MTTVAKAGPRTISMASADSAKELEVWLADPFCFTPWYSAALTNALRDAGAVVRLLAASVSREPKYFAQQGITTDPGPMRFDQMADGWHPRLRKPIRAAAATMNAAFVMRSLNRRKRTRPDVLHLQQLPALNHGMGIDFALIAKAQQCGVPVVHTVHNLLPHDSGSSLRSVYQRLYSVVDHLICHSTDVAEALHRDFNIPLDLLSVVPHGPLFEEIGQASQHKAQARRHLGIPASRSVVLWQGVMAPYKGLDVLIDAWNVCMSRWDVGTSRPLLLIAGTGSAAEESLVGAAAKLHSDSIRADLRYIATTELPFYYQAADLLVYPYRDITTSGALLTGLSYCKPILASDLPPFREYLSQEENAILMPPGDSSSLARTLESLLQDIVKLSGAHDTSAQSSVQQPGDLYTKLLVGASMNRQRYTGWNVIANETLAIYRSLVLS